MDLTNRALQKFIGQAMTTEVLNEMAATMLTVMALEQLTPEHRLNVFDLFCKYCGAVDTEHNCTCQRDD